MLFPFRRAFRKIAANSTNFRGVELSRGMRASHRAIYCLETYTKASAAKFSQVALIEEALALAGELDNYFDPAARSGKSHFVAPCLLIQACCMLFPFCSLRLCSINWRIVLRTLKRFRANFGGLKILFERNV